MELLESAFDKELKKLKNNDLKQFTTFAFGNLHAILRRTQQVIGGAIGGDYGWVAFRKEWYSTTWKWITIPDGTTQKRVSRKWCSLFLTHPRWRGDSTACAEWALPLTLPILHSAKFDLFRRFNIEPILPTQNLLSRIRRSSESKSRKDSPSLKTTSFRLQLYLIANPTLCSQLWNWHFLNDSTAIEETSAILRLVISFGRRSWTNIHYLRIRSFWFVVRTTQQDHFTQTILCISFITI